MYCQEKKMENKMERRLDPLGERYNALNPVLKTYLSLNLALSNPWLTPEARENIYKEIETPRVLLETTPELQAELGTFIAFRDSLKPHKYPNGHK